MAKCLAAYTKPGASYPGYVNISREDDGTVSLFVRGDPTITDGAYVCGYAPRAKGQPGRCTPGDDRCNNYCNMAPGKGPMQDSPAPCVQTFEGQGARLSLSEAEFRALLAEAAKAD